MKATELLHKRIVFADNKFAELVLWQLAQPVAGSLHNFKYRLAYVVDETCVLRYDNEAGKGDHKHVGIHEQPCKFTSPENLVEDFQREITRWEHENSNS